MFEQEEQLYRIEITEECAPVSFWKSVLLGGGFGTLPSSKSFQRGHYGFIPIGTQGWIVQKGSNKFFAPDSDQEGLDLFSPGDNVVSLIAYKQVEGHYKTI